MRGIVREMWTSHEHSPFLVCRPVCSGAARRVHPASHPAPARHPAGVLRGRKVAKGVQMLVIPGSQQVKKEAEAEGLHQVFIDAGAEWRESGCSMCLGMNGDLVPKGQYSVSTSNRNFEGRQGIGARTLLASPLTAAASAVRGRVTDPRELMS